MNGLVNNDVKLKYINRALNEFALNIQKRSGDEYEDGSFSANIEFNYKQELFSIYATQSDLNQNNEEQVCTSISMEYGPYSEEVMCELVSRFGGYVRADDHDSRSKWYQVKKCN